MHFAFTQEQEEFRRSARRFLDKHASTEHTRNVMETERGWDPAVWARACGELGWPALAIPEAYDGFGFGLVEQVALMEELGRQVFGGPVLSQYFAAQLLVELGADAACRNILPNVATGEGLVTVALAEPGGGWSADDVSTTYTRSAGGWRLDGAKAHVLDGAVATLLLVVAREAGTSGPDGVSVFVVPCCDERVDVTLVATMDQSRKKASVSLNGVEVPEEDMLGTPGQAWPAIRRALLRASVALAAEQVGGAQRCLDDAVEYAKVREQFGRPVGSFQAVKHICADMMLLVESARSAAWYAAWAADAGDAGFADAAAAAATYCADAYFTCAGQNIQVHGGVGFTWEYDAHLHFKRATAGKALFGSPRAHREDIAARLLDGEDA